MQNEEQLQASGWFRDEAGRLRREDFGSTLIDGASGVGQVTEYVVNSPDASAIRNQQLLLDNMARTAKLAGNQLRKAEFKANRMTNTKGRAENNDGKLTPEERKHLAMLNKQHLKRKEEAEKKQADLGIVHAHKVGEFQKQKELLELVIGMSGEDRIKFLQALQEAANGNT